MAAPTPVCFGRHGTERCGAVIPGEIEQQQVGPEAFSKDQELQNSDKVTLESVRRVKGDGRRREEEGARVSADRLQPGIEP